MPRVYVIGPNYRAIEHFIHENRMTTRPETLTPAEWYKLEGARPDEVLMLSGVRREAWEDVERLMEVIRSTQARSRQMRFRWVS